MRHVLVLALSLALGRAAGGPALAAVFVDAQRVSAALRAQSPGRMQLILAHELDNASSSALCGVADAGDAEAARRCASVLLGVVSGGSRAARVDALNALARMVSLGALDGLAPSQHVALLAQMAASARHWFMNAPRQDAEPFSGGAERSAALLLLRECAAGAMELIDAGSSGAGAEAATYEAAAALALSTFRLCSHAASACPSGPLGAPSSAEALAVASQVQQRALELQRADASTKPCPQIASRWLWDQITEAVELMLRGEPAGAATDCSLTGLRLLESLLCTPAAALDPSASPSSAALKAALGTRLLPALHSVNRSDAYLTLALSLVPLLFRLPFCRELPGELLQVLCTLPLDLLTSARTVPPNRLRALRCLESLLRQPRVAPTLLACGDLSTHRPCAWARTVAALAAPTPLVAGRRDGAAELQESRLRVRICASVMSQLTKQEPPSGNSGGPSLAWRDRVVAAQGAAAEPPSGTGGGPSRVWRDRVAAARRLRQDIETAVRAMEEGGAKAGVGALQAAGLLEEEDTGGGGTGFDERFGARLGELLFECGEFPPREVGEVLTRPEKRYAGGRAYIYIYIHSE